MPHIKHMKHNLNLIKQIKSLSELKKSEVRFIDQMCLIKLFNGALIQRGRD